VAIFFSLSIAFSTSNINVLAHQMDVNQTNRERVSVDEGSVIRLTNKFLDKSQTQLPVYSLYLPLITNGDPPPSAFNKNAPASGSTGVSLTPVLSWTRARKPQNKTTATIRPMSLLCSKLGFNRNKNMLVYRNAAGDHLQWLVWAWNGTYGPTYPMGVRTLTVLQDFSHGSVHSIKTRQPAAALG
jgi:hypothetical protein